MSKWLLALSALETPFILSLAITRNRYLKNASNAFKKDGSIPTSIKLHLENEMQVKLQKHYNTVAMRFKDDVKIAKKSFDFLSAILVEWMLNESKRKAKLITETMHNDVLGVISDGYDNGETTKDIAKNIAKLSSLTPMRSTVIARTETHNAATYVVTGLAREYGEQSGTKIKKRWVAVNDSRTRDTHAEMIGSEAIDINEQFYVNGEYLDRPGDPMGSPENIINCRCQVVFEEG